MAEIIGTEADDYISWGTNFADIMRGLGGNDILWGGERGDTLDGGDGMDTADYRYGPGPVTVDMHLAVQLGSSDATGDRLISIENLAGSPYADTLTGDDHDNIIRGGKGADHIDGSGGTDRASYAYSGEAVDVDLTRPVQLGGDAAGDTLADIENLTGSDHADHLAGNDDRNIFSGGLGGDIIDGRGGRDFVDYRGSTAIDIDLTRTAQHGGDAEGDQLTSIENIRGSTADDRIAGDAGSNELIGDAGNDFLDGSGGDDLLKGMTGNDILHGGAGDDRMTGGDGADQFYFGQGHDTVTDFDAAEGDVIGVAGDFLGSAGNNFTALMAHAQDTADGLLFTSADGDDSLLLSGLTKADLAESAVTFLV